MGSIYECAYASTLESLVVSFSHFHMIHSHGGQHILMATSCVRNDSLAETTLAVSSSYTRKLCKVKGIVLYL